MKLAYADPPYLGQGKRLYGKYHEEAHIWDELETQISLLWGLAENFDGWAFSATSTSLSQILPDAPECRVGAWIKPFAAWRPNHRVQYTWEPILFVTSRPKGGKGIPSVRDHHSANITMKKGLPGAKPKTFNEWILEVIGYQEGDEFVDMFPGTEGMKEALDDFNRPRSAEM